MTLYSEDQACPSVDPVVLFNMVLIEHLHGPSSPSTILNAFLHFSHEAYIAYIGFRLLLSRLTIHDNRFSRPASVFASK